MHSVLSRLKTTLLTATFLAVMLVSMSPLVASAQLSGPLKPGENNLADLPQYNQGVDESIKAYLCTPSENPLEQGTAVYDCIGRLYRFSLTAGAVVLVFFVVIAGYLYITGGETGKGKAKGILLSAVTGMGILLGSFALLNFINPQLVEIRTIQPPIFDAPNLPSCEAVGFGVRCITAGGQVNSPGGTAGSANEAQYKDLITKYAARFSHTPSVHGYCALSALLQKESSFNKLNVSNPPPRTVDTSASPPSYNVSFANSGHGIGLSQVYIYPGKTSRPGGEFGFSKALTVQDLIDPDTSINAGSYFFAKVVKERRGDLREAYDDYQAGRGGNSDPKTLDKYLEMYNACKLRS